MTDLRKILTKAQKLTIDQVRELASEIHKIVIEKEMEEARRAEQEEIRKKNRHERVTYQLEYKRCGKKNCKTCTEDGKGHGPYWYSYKAGEFGKQRSTYIGKDLQKVGLGPGACIECGKPALEGSFLCPNHMSKV